MSVYLNLRKQFLNKIYFKHIINGQSPFMKHTNRMLKKSERFRVSMKHSLAQKYFPQYLRSYQSHTVELFVLNP